MENDEWKMVFSKLTIPSTHRIGTMATAALTAVAARAQIVSSEDHGRSFPVVVDTFHQRKLKPMGN